MLSNRKLLKQLLKFRSTQPNRIMPISTQFEWRVFPYIPRIIKQFGTPVQIYDEIGIKASAQILTDTFSNHQGFQNFFAVRKCPHLPILKLLKSLGFGFECSTILELEHAVLTGVTPDKIMFISNNPTVSELEYVVKLGCILNIDDINLLKKPIIRKSIPQSVCFTVSNTSDKSSTSEYGLTREQLIPAFHQAQKLGAQKFGLKVQQSSETLKYIEVLQSSYRLFEIASYLKEKLNIKIDFISQDRIRVPYNPGEDSFEIHFLENGIRGYGQTFKQTHGFIPSLCLESSSYVLEPHACIINRAINRKDTYTAFVGLEYTDSRLIKCGQNETRFVTVLDNAGRSVLDRVYEMVSFITPYTLGCNELVQMALPRIRINHENHNLNDLVIIHDTGTYQVSSQIPELQTILTKDNGVFLKMADIIEDDAIQIPLSA